MQYLIIRDLTKADCKEEYRMKHIVVDLEMNNIRQKSEARRVCTMETIEIGAVMIHCDCGNYTYLGMD